MAGQNITQVQCDNKACSLRRQSYVHEGAFPIIPPTCGVCRTGLLIPLDQIEPEDEQNA